jgi:hypothetical protein
MQAHWQKTGDILCWAVPAATLQSLPSAQKGRHGGLGLSR